MNKPSIWTIAVCLFWLTSFLATEAAEKSPDINFNEQIRPLLSENCFACHGPDAESRQADLRLDLRAAALDHGAIVPGSAAESELIARITSDDAELIMPPPDSGKLLSPEQKHLLASWIDAGADWQEHWAFIPPHRSALSQHEGVDAWARNAIDYFIFAKIRELQLQPNAEADLSVLARRAALDLTGLPPDQELLETLLSTKGESAYAQYVGRLLESKHAGEHRARYWLDAARYGDTHGMHVDNYREIWPYRDWVIDAFNSNMPFDQFVIEQVAGDLLPEATLEQRIATGFSRCNITTSEGGAIPEELDVRYMVDRVETTSTVFLGLTAGCAVCHDHKYDPISQREFYQLGAFFNNTTQSPMDGNQRDTPPVVVLPRDDFRDEWYQLQARRKMLQSKLGQWKSTADQWWAEHPASADHPVGTDDLLLWAPLVEGDTFELPKSSQWAADHPAGRRGVRFGEDTKLELDMPVLRSDQPLTFSFWFRTPDNVFDVTLFEQMAKTSEGEDIGWRITSSARGSLKFEMYDGHGSSIDGKLPDNEALRPRSWQHICVRYSGGQANSAITILADGRRAVLRNASGTVISLVGANELADAPLKVAAHLPTGGLSDLRILRRWLSDEEVRLLALDYVVRQQVASDLPWDQLNDQDRELVTTFYNHSLDQEFRAQSRERSATETRRDYIYARSTTTLVMQERPSPPRAWVLERGEYTKRVEEVAPNVPAVLPSLPKEATTDRLSLAQWLVDPNHPLTARVMVNRLWQSVFGVGLVKTAEDFGVMGERPTHPDLLDWLAVEFVESGWNVNHMLELMLTSATYRQSSQAIPEKLGRDPDNRYLSRGPRVRLDAEVIRDQALAVSGLLRRDIGGPGVKPYQPAGLWKVVAITGSNTSHFEPDSGDGLYRRSVYTFWKRTSPPPSMAAFNAPTREQCTVRRERTNTPLQALVMMNDTQFVEAARHLAQSALQHSTTDPERVAWIMNHALRRPASDVEVTELTGAAADFRAIFENDSDAASQLIQTGESDPDATLHAAELAAWTMVANTIMNADEFVNK